MFKLPKSAICISQRSETTMPTLKSINAKAGTNFRRTADLVNVLTGDTPMPERWHPQIHRRSAEQMGLTPADFNWLDFPVSNVRLQHREIGESSRYEWTYRADMPADTPQVNVYESDGTRVPDPQGSALSRVEFALVDTADGKLLHRTGTWSHDNGLAFAGMTEAPSALVWQRLTQGVTLRVRLEATPYFFPYNRPELGDGSNHLSNVNNGYLNGETVSSVEYDLSMTEAGVVLIDGGRKMEVNDFQLRAAGQDEAFHDWLARERRAITEKDAWVTVEIIAGQVGMDQGRYDQIEAGAITPEDWERGNIEDAIKGWQQVYG